MIYFIKIFSILLKYHITNYVCVKMSFNLAKLGQLLLLVLNLSQKEINAASQSVQEEIIYWSM